MPEKNTPIPLPGGNWTPSNGPPVAAPGGPSDPIDPTQRQLIAALEEAKTSPDFPAIRREIWMLAQDGDAADAQELGDMFASVMFDAEAIDRALAEDPDVNHT